MARRFTTMKLALLKRRYRWIDAFYARPRAPGVFRLVFTATPDHVVDDNYSPEPPLTRQTLERILPGVKIKSKAGKRGLAVINQLLANDRRLLLELLAQLPPADVRRYLGDIRPNDFFELLPWLRKRRGFVPKPRDLAERKLDVGPPKYLWEANGRGEACQPTGSEDQSDQVAGWT